MTYIIEDAIEFLSEHPLGTVSGLLLGGSILCCGTCAVGNNTEYSEGTRVGVINKFSKKGIIWQSWEGQIALEGIVSNGNSVGANVWEFSLDNSKAHGEDKDQLAKQVQGYLENGTKVKITYEQSWLAPWPWRAETTYYVQTVKPVVAKKESE